MVGVTVGTNDADPTPSVTAPPLPPAPPAMAAYTHDDEGQWAWGSGVAMCPLALAPVLEASEMENQTELVRVGICQIRPSALCRASASVLRGGGYNFPVQFMSATVISQLGRSCSSPKLYASSRSTSPQPRVFRNLLTSSLVVRLKRQIALSLLSTSSYKHIPSFLV
jgi:hypothetical protein